MALVLDEQQSMLQESIRDFLTQEAPVSHLRKLRDGHHPDGLSPALWREFGLMGFAATRVPEALGGLALGHVETSVVMEEIGRNLTPSPFWSTAVVGATALDLAGTPAQQQALLPSIGTGQSIVALALEERGKHAPEQVALHARVDGGELVLNGAKTFVVDGHVANHFIVVARMEGHVAGMQGLSLVLVEKNTGGVEVERTVMVDAHNAARVRFTDVRVPKSAALGEIGQAWNLLDQVLDAARVGVAAELLGIADEVFRRTVTYLKERSQFGRRIGEFQALQHRISRVFAQVEVVRAAVLKAAQALDARHPRANLHASVAKAKAGSVATLAVQEAVQMHGGMGITDELDIGLFMKRARVLDELVGDHRFHARRVARLIGY